MKLSFKRSVAFLLAVMMVMSVFATMSFTALAENDYTINSTTSTDDYYNLISKRDWDIAPGITESEIVLNNDDGSQRQVLFVMEADLNNEYVKVINSYTGMVPEYGNYQVSGMSNQAAVAEKLGYGNVVGAMNTCLSWYTGYAADRINEPLGFIMLDAEILFDPANCGYEYGNVGFPSVLVINKDFDENGNPRPDDIPKVEMPQIRSAADLDGWEDQVIPCSSGYIVKDGVNQSSPSHTGGAPRSVVGIKADGTVVIMVNDGRQAPYSEGMSMYELAEVMLDLGCTWAVNCDGGGSTTWVSQRPGEDLKINNSPSDGTERSTTTGILFISTAPATGEFVRANITTENEYYVPGSTVKFEALGTDLVGTAAEIPDTATWQIKEENMGTIENGVFVSNGTVGTVTAQMVYNGGVVGEKSIEIVVPEAFAFNSSAITVPFDKTVTIGLTATVNEGRNEVSFTVSDVELTTTNSALGTFNGFSFTSVAESDAPEDLTSTLTATLRGTDLTATTSLSLGKGTEIIEDFENGTDKWNVGCVNNGGTNFSITDATSTSGQVHDGEGSLKFNLNGLNFDNSAGSYKQVAIYPEEDIIIKNAKSIGAWIYIPDEFYNLWIRFHYYYEGADGTYTKKNTVPVFNQPGVYNEVNESGWYYFSVDVSAYNSIMIKGGNTLGKDEAKNCRFIELNACHMATNDIWTTLNGTLNGNYTVYVDSICADFSEAVDDREAPIFNSVSLVGNESETAMENHSVVSTTSNVLNIAAKVSENTTKANATGLNVSTAKAYVDGVLVDSTYSNGKIAISNLAVADGVHRVKFEISDNAGNKSVVIRLVEVTSGVDASTIKVEPKDATLDRLYGGSVYWMNLTATDIETIQSVDTVIDLNSSNHWELDHMELAEGFTATYSVDQETNTATITITRTGSNTQTGEAVLASLPIRVIYYDTDINLDGYTAETYWKDYNFWSHDVKVDVDMGKITYVANYTSNVLNAFSNEEFSVDTEWYTSGLKTDATYKTEHATSHVHTIIALDDKDATCTEKGYTGRTFCEVCNSVVDWGTIVPAKGHSYEIVDGKLTCVNGGELFTGVYTDGKTYADGVIVADGWNADNTAYYVDGVKLTGSHIIDKAVYTFDDNGVYLPDYIYNGFITDNGVTMYFYTNTNYEIEYLYINDAAYYFVDGIAKEGTYTINGEECLFEGGKYISSTNTSVMDAGWESLTVTYIIYNDGSMILGGEGATYKYTSRAQLPWYKYRTEVRSIFIGKEITSLGHYALADIYYTQSITFEEGSKLNYIGAGTFLSCYGITEIVLPDSLQTIVQNSFKMCKNLEDVYLPSSVKYLNKLTFVNNQNVVMPKIKLHVYEGSYAEEYAKEYNIPYEYRVFVDSVIASGTCGTNATWELYKSGKMVIGGSGAMDNYTGKDATPWADYLTQIESVVIGKDITSIGNYAFAYATNVKSVTFEEGSKLEKIGAAAFLYLIYITDVEIPDTVTLIGNLSFAYCSRLVNVYVPQNVTLIYPETFKKSPNVVLNVAEGTYAENYAITNGMSYETREFVDMIIASGDCGENATWTLYASGKMVIGGSGAMDNYASKDVTPWAGYLKQIKSVVIGKDITVIGNYAFAYANNIESVTFEEGSKLEKIGAAAFLYMVYTTEVEIPETVTNIGNLSFAYCSRLVNVVIPQNVTLIYPETFKKSPNVVLNVAEGTYAENYAITNGMSYETREFVDEIIASGDCGENATWTLYASGEMVISGSGAMDNYTGKDATPWAAYLTKIKSVVIGKDITSIGNYAFGYATKMESLTFEEGSKLERIGAAAFIYMGYTTEVVLPETVTYIGNSAFAYCSRLTNVTVPASVKAIFAKTFYKSSKLTLIVVSDSYAENFAIDNGIAYIVK